MNFNQNRNNNQNKNEQNSQNKNQNNNQNKNQQNSQNKSQNNCRWLHSEVLPSRVFLMRLFSLWKLIAVFFADDNNLDSVNMSLLSRYHIVTADSCVTVTAVTELGIFFSQWNTFACFSAGGFNSKSDCILRSGNCFNSLDCLLWRPRLSYPEETLRRSHRTPPQKCPLCKMDNIVWDWWSA